MGLHLYSAPTHTHQRTGICSCMNSNVSLRTQADSSETPWRLEAHVSQTGRAQFHCQHISCLCLRTKPTGHAHSCRLGPQSHKDKEASLSGEKADLQSPGKEVRATVFSDPLAQLVESRLSIGRLLQPGPEEGTSRLVALCGSWQAGWTNVGLGKDGAQEMGSYRVPIFGPCGHKSHPSQLWRR